MLVRLSNRIYNFANMAKVKRPTDTNQRAKSIVDIATGEVKETQEQVDEIKAAAQALGRKGGLKGAKQELNH